MQDDDRKPPTSSQTPNVQIPKLDIVTNSDAECNSEVGVLSIGNVSSNISKESLINFNPNGVCVNINNCAWD